MANITMTYGDYNFRPVPIINIAKSTQKQNDNAQFGTVYDFSLNGTLTAIPTGGLYNVLNLQNQLLSGVRDEGRPFVVSCDGTILISGYPRITQQPQFSESSNNWVYSSPYSMSLQFDNELVYDPANTGLAPPYVADITENWTIEQIEDSSYFSISLGSGINDVNPYQFRLTHNVSAVGKAHYVGDQQLQKQAWQQARDAVVPLLGYNNSFLVNSGVINLNTSGFNAFNHIRTAQTDIKGGSYSVDESWFILNTGQNSGYKAIEDYTVDINTDNENGNVTNITIQGTVQGLEEREYGVNPGDYTISSSKYTNASGLFFNVVNNRLYSRAAIFVNGVADRPLNITPLVKTISHSPNRGSISYSYSNNDRPALCISGAVFENFTVSDTYPNDIYAALTILGRSSGPVLQSLSTSGIRNRDLSFEVRLKPVTGCPSSANNVAILMASSPKAQVDTIITAFKQDLMNNYSQVFLNQDTESWNWKQGQYSRNISWSMGYCG